jgi:tryptophan synthase alpha subunit
MHKSYRTLKKIVSKEGGDIVDIQRKDRMDKVKINFDGVIVGYNFSASSHCNMEKMVKQQIRRLKKEIA